MKKCHSCGYEDNKGENSCPVCGDLLVSLPSDKKKFKHVIKYFKLLLVLVIVCFVSLYILRHTKPAKIDHLQKLPAYPYEDRIEKSINALSEVIVPDYTEQEVVFTYLERGSQRLKIAACRTLIYWAAYSKNSRQLYLNKAAQPLYVDFDKKDELIDIFTYFLSMKIFLPQELNFMLKQLSLIACSKDYKTAQKALRLALMIDENANVCKCCESINYSFADFDVKSREICNKSCFKAKNKPI